jgi:hypothetical protein
MIKDARQFGWAFGGPGASGALIVLSLFAARAFASATVERVYVLGYEAHWACIFRQLFALPCPGCGLTRGSLLALDGHLNEAFALNPAAPLVVFGLALLAASLLSLAVLRRARSAHAAGLFTRRLRTGVRLYGALTGAVLFVNWLAQLLRG